MIGRTPEALFSELLNAVASAQASDLHLSVGRPPILRIDGQLAAVKDLPPLSTDDVVQIAQVVLGTDRIPQFFHERREVDVAFERAASAVRFRTNIYWTRGEPTIALRALEREVRTIQELNLPESLLRFAEPQQGFVLIVGPSGHGKTTTMASLVNSINRTRTTHIVTIEDPVEYVFREDKALIHQREVGTDTHAFPDALRAVLREDPNVVMIGEMRDLETIATALTVAETGHLVFTTLHTNDAAQTIDRIVDAFPAQSQPEVRVELAATLTGIISQRLLPRVGGGRIPAVEVLVATPAVRNLIREGETAQIPGMIQTGALHGMITLEQSLRSLAERGEVTPENAGAFLAAGTLEGGPIHGRESS